MDFFQGIAENYSSFFSWDQFVNALSTPENWAIIGSLIILEGLLSADNALVLAVMVRHLPEDQRKKALFYGIFGAYVFRFIAIGIGAYLIQVVWIKVAGGLYLLWLAYSNLFRGSPGENDLGDQEKRKQWGFWRTILAVEMMDIAFSIDSVVAALGVSNEVWVLMIGGMLGVLMMRSVAQLFLKLIEKIPEFEKTAFILIAIIGVNMIAGSFGFHIGEVVFFSILISVFAGTFVVHKLRHRNNPVKTDDSEKNVG